MRFDDAAVQGMIQARRAIGTAQFPGQPDVKIGIRLVSERDVDLARFHGHLYLDTQCKKVELRLSDYVGIDPESLDRETQRQVILVAILDLDQSTPDNPVPFFSNIEQVRSLDTVCFQQIWEAYADWQDAVNPKLNLTEEKVKELGDILKAEPDAKVVLAHIAPDTLRGLVRFLVVRPPT